jgi:competence protein ComEC
LGRVKSAIFSALGILFYALLVGFSAPVLRSALMAWIALLGKAFGRPREALLALLVSASILLFANPLSLSTVSFQLSFAATLGLLLLSSGLKASLFFLPPKAAEAAATTIAASVFVCPILALNFGSFSLVSPLANVLVFLLIEPILFFGTSAIFLALVVPLLGKLFSYFAWIPLTAFVFVAELLSKPNWSSLNIGKGNSYFWVVYYLLLGVAVAYFQKVNRGAVVQKQ